MIITTATGSAMVVTGGPGAEPTRVRCLARQDLVHSETEAFEHLGLGPGAHFHRAGRPDTEAAWYVLRGPVVAELPPGETHVLADTGDLLLLPRGEELRLQTGPLGAELLCLTLRTAAVPTRRPIRTSTRP